MASVQELRGRLGQAREDLEGWMRQAAQLLGDLTSARRALAERTALELDEEAGDYAKHVASLPKAATSPWDDPSWKSYSGQEQGLLTSVRIGTLSERGLFEGERGVAGQPALVPFLTLPGAILLRCDENSRDSARRLMQSLILRMALTMPTESRFTLLDRETSGQAFPMRGQLPRVRQTARSLVEELEQVNDDVRRIYQDVVRHADSFAALSSQERAGEQFEIIAAVDFPQAYRNDPRAVDSLVRLATSGPKAGRLLILEAHANEALPREFTYERLKNAYEIDLREGKAAAFKPDPVPAGSEQQRLLEAAARNASRSQAGSWQDQVRPKDFFSHDSRRRVETPVGERLTLWLGDADDGTPSAHALVAGQTGSGKSYLLHVLITGLAARYSPQELRFVLIDGKQGVEMEAYRELPHVDVVCLRTSPEMARSVLEDYAAEMDDRYERFTRAGVNKLEEYRSKTGEILPRMLLIVDEYQQLLEGDAERGARLLSRILEKGRAAGTHLILGSQTFNVQGLPATAISHIQLRISLALAPDYLQGTQVFGPEGKRLIKELASSGEIVANQKSGADGANRRGAVARFESSTALAEAIRQITTEARRARGDAKPRPPVVLSGRDGAILFDNPFVVVWRKAPPAAEMLQTVARRPVRQRGFGIETWSMADNPLPLWLGRKFDVRGHALAVLRRAPGNHLLLLGSQAPMRLLALANALAALPCMIPVQALSVDLVDGLFEGLPGEKILQAGAKVLARRGAQVRRRGPEEIEAVLAEARADLEKRAAAPASIQGRHRLIVLSEPEYLSALQAGAQSYGPPPKGPATDLREILQRGPQLSVHLIITASGLSALGTILSPTRELRGFSHRVVQQMNEEDSMTLFASLIGARIEDQAGHPSALLYVDQLQGARQGTLFKGYGASHDLLARQDAAALEAQLEPLLETEHAVA